MLFSATSARRVRLSASLFLTGLSLLFSSCGASRTAFRFQLAPPLTIASATTAEPAFVAEAPKAARQAPRATPAQVTRSARRPLPQPVQARLLARIVREPSARPAIQSRAAQPAVAARKATFGQLVRAPRHGAEVGLGTTVLGVLGLVVLPIALLGLLIWGGPVWAVLAGLAGLAVLVAYLDPFK
ncbi:hypothetical protein [Hymenobacter persicinus]|uniref:Uncharacterized protein n=1 Tax=Hymenobacter persicinus TaxID=2025506 RepID=A0A4V1ZAL3_9BACT|nr:hypothetical protein [Hymenobacter persicinus]RYU78625.1 hypothetical protein EWM57_13355 [Hymenobacter persicinus]